MPALRSLRWFCLTLCAGATVFAAKPIQPHGPGGSTVATARPLRFATETIERNTGSVPVQFRSAPEPLPANVASVGFEASATAEFGDLIRLQGDAHFVGSIAVTLTTAAIRSDYLNTGPFGFSHPITLTVYSVDRNGAVPQAGATLAHVTETFLIPWRPEPDPSATFLPGRPWRSADGNYYTGRAVSVTFDVGESGLALPDDVIVSVSFNTQHAGTRPLGVPGPYDFLGVGLSDEFVSAGLDVEPDAVFWKTANAAAYTEPTAANNTLHRDTGWLPFKPAIRVNDSNYGVLYSAVRLLDDVRASERDLQILVNAARAYTADALDRQLWEGNQRLAPAYGDFVFENLADATDALHELILRREAHAELAQRAIDAFVASSATLADLAIADALILGGNTHNILRAQNAVDRAATAEARGGLGVAIDQQAAAWREAQSALR
jgi:hypothetical protein